MIHIVLAYSRSTTAQSNGPSWTSNFRLVAKLWQRLLESFLDSYRPELHYMRGPGPRWQFETSNFALMGTANEHASARGKWILR